MWPELQNIIHNLLWEIFLRVVILALVCIIQIKVHPRMFHITEADLLSHYKRPRHDSYIPPSVIVIIVVFVPLLFIYFVFSKTESYVDTIEAILAWTLALSITAMITESLKLAVGRPRPDYFYRCFPDGEMKSVACTANTRDIIEGRKSFPSGHTSFSFCSLGFLCFWIWGKWEMLTRRRGNRYRALSCLILLSVAGVVAWSRHYDNHHHWGDIFAGIVVGLASSYYSYRRYYHSLTSERSGQPLTTVTENELIQSYLIECCSRDLSDDLCMLLHLSSKNSFESR